MKTTSREEEIKRHLVSLEIEPDDHLVLMIEFDLGKRTKGWGCISPGGCSVRSWIQYWLVERGAFPVGEMLQEEKTVTCVFHFWPWDTDKYGPQPTEDVGTNLDTMRSPVWRIQKASPINRVACRVTGQTTRTK